MIYITGDTHTDIYKINNINIPEGDNYLIICGDFGFIYYDNDQEKALLDELEKKPYTVLFVDGNHENFKALYKYPVEEWNGGRVHRIRRNILHLMRGQVFTIEGKAFFTMGGAYSPDRYMRIRDYSFWSEELPNDAEYKEAAKNLERYNNKVDYIITHTAPSEILRRMGYSPDCHEAELTGFLEWIMYSCEFRHWYFGHFHEDKAITDKITTLFYDVVVIE